MKKNVLIVGAGNLGRRHLQSLNLSATELKVYVVDFSKESLALAKEAAEQAELTMPVSYFSSIEMVPGDIDAAIVATTANPRLSILKALLAKGVENIVLEKIAFNSLHHIDEAKKLVSSGGANIWVNCPRRLYPVYKSLKDELDGAIFKRFTVKGNNFGIGCNGIHFIDLLSYLINDSNYNLSSNSVIEVEESKRAGYVEFFGSFNGRFDSGCQFELQCGKDSEKPEFELHLEMDQGTLTIFELEGKAVLDLGGRTKTIQFTMPFQSELTGPMMDGILLRGECDLTGFMESMELHRPFIAAAYESYAACFSRNNQESVPIT